MIVGADTLAFSSWKADVSGKELETTNFNSYVLASDTSFEEGILGTLGCATSFGGDWDAGDNPLDDPPGLFPRDDLADVKYVVNQTDANFWDFAYMRLRTASSGANSANDKITFECSGMNQGPFIFPIGSQ